MHDPVAPLRVIRFGLFEADMAARELRRDGLKVKLQGRPFELLVVLLEQPGDVVTREALRERFWPANTFVDFDHSLNISVNKLRFALGDFADNPRFIATVGRVGYRFIAPVERPQRVRSFPETVTIPETVTNMTLPSRARGLSRTVSYISMLMLVWALVYLAWHHWWMRPQPSSGKVMLAVLPFENISHDSDQDYFSEGLTEEIITQLAALQPQRIGVIARSSAMRYTRGEKPMRQIGRELGVQYVLEGSVRRASGRARIAAQLIQVKDQNNVWAKTFERDLRDMFSLESEVARAIADGIQVELTPTEQTRLASAHRVSQESYEAYLKGRYFWNRRTADGFRRAIGSFQEAIKTDPNYAQAYAGLADVYTLLGGYGFILQRDSIPEAKVAARKALEIDDRLAETHASLGLIATIYDWNWKEAEREYKRAIELNQNCAIAHEWYGEGYLALMQRFDEATQEIRRARELDPLSPIINTDAGVILYFERQYDQAIKQFLKTLELEPNFVIAHYFLAQAYEQKRMYADGLVELRKMGIDHDNPLLLGPLGHLYAVSGKKGEALNVLGELQKLSKRSHLDSKYIAHIYIGLGQNDLAFKWLEKAYVERSPGMTALKVDPVYDQVRSDARFQDLLRRVGLSP
jgi:TolB-like protein/DNA-binding winged helix-turn-helix (wHTH) protein/Tfp pilus assembly protein PilF